MTPEQIRIVACCSSCKYARGYDGIEWCVAHRLSVLSFHSCDNYERSDCLTECAQIQDKDSTSFALEAWHGEA